MWVHLLAAMLWVGGLAFIGMVLAPTLRQPALRAQAVPLLRTAGRKFMRIAYASLAALVVTGTANVYLKAGSWAAAGALAQTAYGRILATKVVLVAAIVALSLYHDLVVGPAAARAMESDATGATATRLRKTAAWIGRANMLLSIAVVTLALLLVRGVPA